MLKIFTILLGRRGLLILSNEGILFFSFFFGFWRLDLKFISWVFFVQSLLHYRRGIGVLVRTFDCIGYDGFMTIRCGSFLRVLLEECYYFS